MKKSQIALFALVLSATSFSLSCHSNSGRHLTKIFDYVFDAGTYTSLDYKFAENFFAKRNDDWGGNCSAVFKMLNNAQGEQDVIVGRNLDLTLSNKAAYIIRTAVPGCKKTVGLAYSHRDYAPDYKDVLDYGVLPTFDKVAPFGMDDILNEDGLYIEVNMRPFEMWPDGSVKYSCSGTNEGKQRVYAFTISRYIAENCSTVEEAIKYLDNFDIYTSHDPGSSWNYAFMIADAAGNHAVIEFIDNEVYVSKSNYNLNFWLNEAAYETEQYRCGLGREEYINDNYDSINTTDDMKQLMYDLFYFTSYDSTKCKYEIATESVGDEPHWTTDYVLSHKEEIYQACQDDVNWMKEVGMDKVRDANYIWYSIFSSVVNLNKRTFHTTFYEKENLVMDIDLNENHIINTEEKI